VQELRDLRATQRDIWAWNALMPLAGEFVPWTSGSLAPRALLAILNEIVFGERRRIVECGGGTSTVFVGRLLDALGSGELRTIESSPEWAAWLDRRLADEGLQDRVEVCVAPLVPRAPARDAPHWYDETAVKAAIAERRIDLLVVDGPRADRPEWRDARRPALAFFRPFLSEDACVILDDIGRDGEREIVRAWEEESDFVFERRFDLGLAVGRRPGSPSAYL
jgi:predicted O-methyltransferase YrrM